MAKGGLVVVAQRAAVGLTGLRLGLGAAVLLRAYLPFERRARPGRLEAFGRIWGRRNSKTGALTPHPEAQEDCP